MFDLVVSSVLADDLAPLGTRASTSTVMTKFRSHMYVWEGHLKSQALWCPGNLSSTKVSLVGSSSWCMMRTHNGATWQLWYMVVMRELGAASGYLKMWAKEAFQGNYYFLMKWRNIYQQHLELSQHGLHTCENDIFTSVKGLSRMFISKYRKHK